MVCNILVPNHHIVLQVNPEKVNIIIGSGGKKVKSIIEESGVEAIDTQDDGIVSSNKECICIGLFDMITNAIFKIFGFCR